jgi:hypothetical protein
LGRNKEYFESHEGRLIDAKDAKARYVRVVLKGHGTWHPTPIGAVRIYGHEAK